MTVPRPNTVRETAAAPGTGPLTLAGAASGYRAYGDALPDGSSAVSMISDGTNWERSIGIYTAGVLTRDVVLLGSSGAGVKVNFVGAVTVSLIWPTVEQVGPGARSYAMGEAR